MSAAELLSHLEAISRERPDRVLRLLGRMPSARTSAEPEPFEVLLYRGFSSSTTHPTDFDADRPLLPPDAVVERVDLLAGPLNPQAEELLASTQHGAAFLEPAAWR
jgi:hypothetical protein